MKAVRTAPGVAILSSAALLLCTATGIAQTPSLKREPPPAPVMVCPVDTLAAPMPVDTAASATVDRLTGAATQALILGDLSGADTLLARVLEADPGATEAAYLRGRIAAERDGAPAAVSWFCRYLDLAPSGSSAPEARRRLEEAAAGGAGEAVYAAFAEGVERYGAGDLEGAEERFSWLVAARPGVADAFYNRGMIRAAAGRPGPARQDLERYLELAPGAADAPVVQAMLADIAGIASGPRPAPAFLLGTIFPGGGQYYTRRPALGAVITGLAAGALGAGFLYERTTILCREPDPSGGCTPDAIVAQDTERPLLVPGLAVAGGLALVAAIEAALHAGRRREARPSPVGRAGEAARIQLAPGPTPGSSILRLSLIRLRF